jgi:Cof subfamily protein (haloacid dehalogenase superfamily)
MRYPFLAVDLDGTLLNREKEISEENRDAIREYVQKGGRILIASGRNPLATQWISEVLGIDDIRISFNGAVIDKRGARRSFSFRREEVMEVVRLCTEHSLYLHLYDHLSVFASIRSKWNEGWEKNNILSLTRSGASPDKCLHYREMSRVRIVGDLHRYMAKENLEVYKIAVFGEPEMMRMIASELERKIPTIEVSTSLNYLNLELSPGGVSKGSSLKMILEEEGIPMEHLVAIGDNYNDSTMLALSGMGIAMEGTPEDVRRLAKNTAPDVAYAIRHFLFL